MLDPRRRIALNSVTMIIWFIFFGMRLFSRYYGRRKTNLGIAWYLADGFVFVAILVVTVSNCLDTWIRSERLQQDPNPWVADGKPSLLISSYKVRSRMVGEEGRGSYWAGLVGVLVVER